MNFVPCYIGLGSNLENPQRQVVTAIQEIEQLPRTQNIRSSSLYSSPPMGPRDQPDYINAVVAIDTAIGAEELLHRLLAIEQSHGRIREERRWTARTLDLDLLLYGQEIIETALLTTPHPGIAHRNFVLYPLQEIAPRLNIPRLGPVAQLIAGCERGDLVKLHLDRSR
jgi:2-amino-4-hydroxy-6-hydroxymethyldihydropteridine diphosphokinase